MATKNSFSKMHTFFICSTPIPQYYRQNLEQLVQFVSFVHYGQSCDNTGYKLLFHKLTPSWWAIILFTYIIVTHA